MLFKLFDDWLKDISLNLFVIPKEIFFIKRGLFRLVASVYLMF